MVRATEVVERTEPRRGPGRLVFYCTALLVAGSIAFAGFVYPSLVPPDPGTRLGMAEMHVGFAQILSRDPENEKALGFRDDQLAKARALLDEVEADSPGLAITSEYRAFCAWVEGDFDAAARCYLEVLERTSDEDLCAKTRVNLARVEMEAGRPEAGLACLARVSPARRGARWQLASARGAELLGHAEARRDAMAAALGAAKTDETLLREVAEAAFHSDAAIALSAYERVREKSPMTWYRIAVLKIRRGQIDSAADALGHAREAAPRMLARLLERDRAIWEPYEGKAGFMQMPAEPAARAATPGR